jgi:hypothetical protein
MLCLSLPTRLSESGARDAKGKGLSSKLFSVSALPEMGISEPRLSFRAQNLGRVSTQRAKHGRECGNERSEHKGTRRQPNHIRVG